MSLMIVVVLHSIQDAPYVSVVCQFWIRFLLNSGALWLESPLTAIVLCCVEQQTKPKSGHVFWYEASISDFSVSVFILFVVCANNSIYWPCFFKPSAALFSLLPFSALGQRTTMNTRSLHTFVLLWPLYSTIYCTLIVRHCFHVQFSLHFSPLSFTTWQLSFSSSFFLWLFTVHIRFCLVRLNVGFRFF